LGSAQVITDYEGELYERIEYTPYGETWIEHKYPGYTNTDIPYRFTGKELDAETGFYYYGARYLDPRTSRWLSGDPALGEYLPQAPVNDEAKKNNGNLPGQGGVFNLVNLHVYHYAGNNPVKYVDPDGSDVDEAYVIQAAQASGPVAAAVLVVGTALVIATNPDVSQGITSGTKAIWDGIGELGTSLMAASDAIKSGVASLFNAKAPVRDKEGNPIPIASQSPSPLGKGANGGPMNIGNPGDLGGPNFRPPNPTGFIGKVAAILGIGAGGAAVIHDGYTNAASTPPPDPANKSRTMINPFIYAEPSFSNAEYNIYE
jgi:RHS repeat-associated protein